MPFPIHRPRRLRKTETMRRMVRETRLSVDDLIYPLFVCPGEGVREPIEAMRNDLAGMVHHFEEEVEKEVSAVADAADPAPPPTPKESLGGPGDRPLADSPTPDTPGSDQAK